MQPLKSEATNPVHPNPWWVARVPATGSFSRLYVYTEKHTECLRHLRKIALWKKEDEEEENRRDEEEAARTRVVCNVRTVYALPSVFSRPFLRLLTWVFHPFFTSSVASSFLFCFLISFLVSERVATYTSQTHEHFYTLICLCYKRYETNNVGKYDRSNDRPKLAMLAIKIGPMIDRGLDDNCGPILACYIGPKITPDYRPRIAARVKPTTFLIYIDMSNDNEI